MAILGNVKTITLPQVEPAQPLESPQSFAKFVGVSAQAVRNWIKDGTIPVVVHTGRIVRFERAAALNALQKGGAR